MKESAPKRGVFHTAVHAELAKPMLEAVGWPLMAAFAVTLEVSEIKPHVTLCMEGFRLGISLTKDMGADTLRYAFLTSLVRWVWKFRALDGLKMRVLGFYSNQWLGLHRTLVVQKIKGLRFLKIRDLKK